MNPYNCCKTDSCRSLQYLCLRAFSPVGFKEKPMENRPIPVRPARTDADGSGGAGLYRKQYSLPCLRRRRQGIFLLRNPGRLGAACLLLCDERAGTRRHVPAPGLYFSMDPDPGGIARRAKKDEVPGPPVSLDGRTVFFALRRRDRDFALQRNDVYTAMINCPPLCGRGCFL